jgi:hypothetical protein
MSDTPTTLFDSPVANSEQKVLKTGKIALLRTGLSRIHELNEKTPPTEGLHGSLHSPLPTSGMKARHASKEIFRSTCGERTILVFETKAMCGE